MNYMLNFKEREVSFDAHAVFQKKSVIKWRFQGIYIVYFRQRALS